MLDPLIARILAICFALLFISAALHKLGNRQEFREILAAYQLLPLTLLSFAAIGIPVMELLLGLAWLVGGISPLPFYPLAPVTAVVIAGYAFAIGLNLARGRSYIDCGCGFSTSLSSLSQRDKQGAHQQLSMGLVVRNLLLATLALVAGLPATGRGMGILDYTTMLLAVIAIVFVYGASNQLLVNRNAMGAWSRVHD